MKKVLVAILITFMAISLTACGREDDYAEEIEDLEDEIKDLKKENKELRAQLEEKGSSKEEDKEDSPEEDDFVVETRGVCGADLTWEYGNGILKIHGTGEMADYNANQYHNRPWEDIKEKINHVYVDEGCTYIGKDAFADISGLSKVVLPGSAKSAGDGMLTYDRNVRLIIWGDKEYKIDDPSDDKCVYATEEKIVADGWQVGWIWGFMPAEAAAPAPAATTE